MNTSPAPTFSFDSSLNPNSIFGYIRSFLVGRTGQDFLQECYSLQEAYEELSADELAKLPEAQREAVLQAQRLISKLIGFAKSQGV